MIADCRQQKQKEQELGKSSHSTEILMEDGQSFDQFLESLNVIYEPPAHMTARLKIRGNLAKCDRGHRVMGGGASEDG